MGPVEVIVIGFAHAGRLGSIGEALESLVAAGQLRIVDAMLVALDGSGAMIVSDLEDGTIADWSVISPDPRPLLGATDASLVARGLSGDHGALMLAVEHLWPAALQSVAADDGDTWELHVRIDTDVVEAAALAAD